MWSLRHYIANSVRLELLGRFRRTQLGLAYVAVLPLAFAVMFAWVLATLSNQPFGQYVFFVYANLVLWEFITGSIALGAGSVVAAEGFLRAQRMPSIVFPLRTCLSVFISLLIASAGVVLLALIVDRSQLTIYTPLAFANVLFIALCILPYAVVSGMLGVVFRDWQHLVGLGLQFLWFMSPVFFLPTVFDRPDLALWTYINPIANAMEIWRGPLIEGRLPNREPFVVLAVWGLLGYAVATTLVVRIERKLLFFM